MKSPILLLFIVLGVMLAAPASSYAAEQKAAPTPPVAAEPLGENEPIPFMRTEQGQAVEEPGSGSLLLKTLGSMIFIVGLIFVGAWGAKKLGFAPNKAAGPGSEHLAVLQSVSLGNGRTISAVQFGRRTLIIGSTPQSFTLLAEENGESAAVPEKPRSVAELLAEDGPSFEAVLDKAAAHSASPIFGGQLS